MREQYGNHRFFIEDNIGYIELGYLPANKMTQDFFQNLSELIQELQVSHMVASLAGIIIMGAGKHFSAGADVDMLREMMKEIPDEGQEVHLPSGHVRDKKCFTSLSKLPVPVIAVVKGFCIGSGLELALGCNIRIAEKKAKVGFPESTFGFMPALGGNVNAVKYAGIEKALDMVLSGDIYKVSEVENWGLFDYITEKDEGLELAKKILLDGAGEQDE